MCKLLNGKSLLFAALLLSAISMSCSKEPQDTNSKQSGNNVHEWEDSTLSGDAVMGSAMTFKVGGGMSVERTAQTRATTDINGNATFTEGDLVAVAVTRSGGSEVVKLYQVKSDGSLEYAGGDNDPFVWKSAGESVTIRAWSYGTSNNLSYTLTAPETFDYTLETDQQTNGYRELLYCKADNKSYSGGAITLNFYHQLARMVFNVTHESSNTLTISSVSIGSSSFPQTARFNVPTGSNNVGTWVVKSGTGSITPRTETPPTTGYLATYSAVVFPTFTTQNYPKDTPFFTVTSGTNNYTYKIAESGGMAYDGNTQYNYTINVKDDGLIFYPSTYTAADITYGDYYSVTSTGQPVLVKNSAVTDAINAGITPKAVVFALKSEMNSTDATKWPHGYAMALKDAGERIAWSTRSVSVQTSSHIYTSPTVSYSDMGGYEATHNITDRNSADPTNFNATTYPAFFRSLNYDAAPTGSSGWFLPTNGQWLKILVNLGGMTAGLADRYWGSGTASIAASNLNRYLDFDSSIATKFQRAFDGIERMYWCSGEYDASTGCVISFDNGGKMWCYYTPGKATVDWEGGYLYARACIAF